MTVMGSPYHRDEYRDEYGEDPSWPGQPPSRTEEIFGALSYAGAIATGPLLPLIVYLGARTTSEFVRSHAVQALNVTLTALLYAVSGTIVGVLLSFDSPGAALGVMLPITVAAAVIVIVNLARGAAAAYHGEYREFPSWICAPLVS